MNDFRSRILNGNGSGRVSLLTTKTPRNKSGGDSLQGVAVARTESRIANHREKDRHRLAEEQSVRVRWGREQHQARLINLSGGGAMIEAPFRPELWDRIELDLGAGASSDKIECAVRWIKGDRIGLEFAHETRIDADAETRSDVLRQVLVQSFPDVHLELAAASPSIEALEATSSNPAVQEEEDYHPRAAARHPLIWVGSVHFEHETTPVRLRNISATGALVEGGPAFKVGGELLLDLDEAGSHFATVRWVRGDQAGLAFRSAFDLALLAKSKPQLAPSRWTKPTYLRDESSETSPWASEWGRLSLSDLHKRLDR